MKKIIVLTIIILVALSTAVFAKGAHASHASHVSHSSTHVSSSGSKSTISGAKTYTTPKNFTGKYNTSNIKTEKVQEASNYGGYSMSNTFRPNFWTAMWAFQCMHDNTEEVTEQDIAKELEERGYSQEEIQAILKEGEEAKQAQKEEDENTERTVVLVIIGIIVVIAIIVAIVFARI